MSSIKVFNDNFSQIYSNVKSVIRVRTGGFHVHFINGTQEFFSEAFTFKFDLTASAVDITNRREPESQEV